jgi:formylglycine-generating enzyme required for sulfatase activity/tRNA A-37 threonylcarbamoyl transferase component Bud32/predicted esterase
MSFMIGKTILHYRILVKLGEGGMGVVYKAEDTKLKREVAIKFLPRQIAASKEERERFEIEAQAAAALNHPNIATIYAIEEVDDEMFIVMEYIEGRELREMVDTEIPNLQSAIEYASQIAEGLNAAHKKGIIHRDIKSSNVMVTDEGQAKIMDFGLAKVAGGQHLTKSGMTVGTVACMSPEQARGEKVDHRTDIWSLGVVFYEMLTGQMPFKGEYEQAVVYSMLHEEPQPPKELRAEIPEELQEIILQALEKDPQERFQSTGEVLQSLKKLRGEKTVAVSRALNLMAFLHLLRRPRFAVLTLAIILLLSAAIFFPYRHLLKVQRATQLLPKIDNLAQVGKYLEAYQLAVEAEKVLENNSTIARLMPTISDKLTIITQPEGARVTLKRFLPEEAGQSSESEYPGVTPIHDLRIARRDYYVLLEKEGYVPMERIASSALNRNEIAADGFARIEVKLHKVEEVPENMVYVPGGDYHLVSSYRPTEAEVHLDDYFMDRFEVSNMQYKAFVSAGGYLQKKFWKYRFIENGNKLSWQEAMQHFTDRTGLAGPRNWVNQEYPEGKARHPVTGITWYEASAYAEFVGKSLPTVFQWEKAARGGEYTHFSGAVLPWGLAMPDDKHEHRANFDEKDSVPVNSYEFGLSTFGCYNMAGNVKEWCLNEMGNGFVATGGSWEQQISLWRHFGAHAGFHSSSSIGFRCVKMLPGGTRDQGAMRLNIETETPSYSPVDEATFYSFLSHYQYDKKPLNVEIVETLETEDWRREKVTFAGVGRDRIIAYVYLPKRAAKPFQCINFAPGSDFFLSRSAPEYVEWVLPAQIKAGRAVMALVPTGAVERPHDPDYVWPEIHTVKWRDRTVLHVTEYSIGLDYLATRDDIDMNKLAHIGFSWGAGVFGVVYTALEDRYSSVILIAGSIWPQDRSMLPEANPINFAPRIQVPKLMLHGKSDEAMAYKTRALPLFNLLKEPKRLELVEGGHLPALEIRVPIINNWLDETLGSVKYK